MFVQYMHGQRQARIVRVLVLTVFVAYPTGCTSRGLVAGHHDGAPFAGGSHQPDDAASASGGRTGSGGNDGSATLETSPGPVDARGGGGTGGTWDARGGGGTGGVLDTNGSGGTGGLADSGGSGGTTVSDARDGAAGVRDAPDSADHDGRGVVDTGSESLGAYDAGRDPCAGFDAYLCGLAVDPLSIDFGVVELKASSTAVITVFNRSGTPMPVPGSLSEGDVFRVVDWSCRGLLEPLTSCQVTLSFTPNAVGTVIAGLTIGTSVVVGLRGEGIAAATFTATSRVDLGTVIEGDVVPVVVQIVPDGPLSRLSCVAGGGDLTLTRQTCPASGVVDAPCSFTYAFESWSLGSRSDAVICTGPGDKTTATLVTAEVMPRPSVTLSPSPVTLSATQGTTATATITVSNPEDVDCTGLAVNVSTTPTEFAIVATDCASALAAHATCTVEVAFSPIVLGEKSGHLFASCGSSFSTGIALVGKGL